MATATPSMSTPATFTPLPPYYYQGATGAVAPVHQGGGAGSIGAFFAVLAAVLVLTLLSCVFGRVCARHAEGPDERYDCTRLARRWWGGAPRGGRIVRREAKPSPPVVVADEEAPAALPPPEP